MHADHGRSSPASGSRETISVGRLLLVDTDRCKRRDGLAIIGQTLLSRFTGWRVGLLATEPFLASATGLPFQPPGAPVAHGGLRVTLYQTGVLG